ncbi:MAG: hypothetical protein WDA27_14025 [Actinomycetota bacterium]
MKSLRLAVVLAASLVFGAMAGPDIVRVAAEGTESPAPVPAVSPDETPAVEPTAEPSSEPTVEPTPEPTAEPTPGEVVDPPAPEPSADPQEPAQEPEADAVHGAVVSLVAGCAPKGHDPRFAGLVVKNHGGFVSAAARGGTAEVAGSVFDLSTVAGAQAFCSALDELSVDSAGVESPKVAKKAARNREHKHGARAPR